jgi:hypothetical protein
VFPAGQVSAIFMTHLLPVVRWLKLLSDHPPENLERALAVVFGESSPEMQQTYSPARRRSPRKKVPSCSSDMVLLLEPRYDKLATNPLALKKQKPILSARLSWVDSG